ncbi:MAG: ATP-dependent sacrificial sulfur transferase LarE [Candidatus Nezhaarchaeota archaeon]|nr:ATP-dependent sacrificial sulfur transferase LarE [Candidatus Nezhaarchaeota archaeon]
MDLEKITCYLKNLERVAVMLSGGVDSSLLTFISTSALGRERVVAVTVDSPLTFRRDLEDARNLAHQIGIEHLILPANELSETHVALNTPLRCYKCKKLRIRIIKEGLRARGYDGWVVVDGTNVDEAKDRPGLKALNEEGVCSPFILFGVKKDDIRRVAAMFGLPTARKPPNSCKATRIATFTPLNLKLLSLVEEVENSIKELVGDGDLRVRISGSDVKIEVAEEIMPRILNFKREVTGIMLEKGLEAASLILKPYIRR